MYHYHGNKSRVLCVSFAETSSKSETDVSFRREFHLGRRGKVARDRIDFFLFFSREKGGTASFYHTSSSATISRRHGAAFFRILARFSRHEQGYINSHGNFINDRKLINDRLSPRLFALIHSHSSYCSRSSLSPLLLALRSCMYVLGDSKCIPSPHCPLNPLERRYSR